MPRMSMAFSYMRIWWVKGMTTSGQIAQGCRIKCPGGTNCLRACKIVTMRKVSWFIKESESKGTRTQGPPSLTQGPPRLAQGPPRRAHKVLHNFGQYTKELHSNPRADFESYAI